MITEVLDPIFFSVIRSSRPEKTFGWYLFIFVPMNSLLVGSLLFCVCACVCVCVCAHAQAGIEKNWQWTWGAIMNGNTLFPSHMPNRVCNESLVWGNVSPVTAHWAIHFRHSGTVSSDHLTEYWTFLTIADISSYITSFFEKQSLLLSFLRSPALFLT